MTGNFDWEPIWVSVISQSIDLHLMQVIDRGLVKNLYFICSELLELIKPFAIWLVLFGRAVISFAIPDKMNDAITFNFKLPSTVWVLLAWLAINFRPSEDHHLPRHLAQKTSPNHNFNDFWRSFTSEIYNGLLMLIFATKDLQHCLRNWEVHEEKWHQLGENEFESEKISSEKMRGHFSTLSISLSACLCKWTCTTWKYAQGFKKVREIISDKMRWHFRTPSPFLK